MGKLLACYQQLVEQGVLRSDPEQAQLINQFQAIDDALSQQSNVGWLRCFRQPIRGLYLWGHVGVGKTCMMDLFYDCLSTSRKERMHFHEFMETVHQALQQLQGCSDPLVKIAKRLAKRVDILCFDEFVVLDIVDAMILANLLQALFDAGLVLVTTSNTPVDALYRRGFQRERFLPAIALLKAKTTVIEMTSQQDYRVLLNQGRSTNYYSPINASTNEQFKAHFKKMAGEPITWGGTLTFDSRSIKTVAYSERAVWFKFEAIVSIPRCQRDYLFLAKQFGFIFISQIPMMKQKNSICNLIKLIDVLYDNGINLVIQGAVPREQLCDDPEFKRADSRLQAMQKD